MKSKAEIEWKKHLTEEGFECVYIWEDKPGTKHDNHAHPCYSAHVILEGSMTVSQKGEYRLCKRGDRFDVNAGIIHSVSIGKDGCRYIVGERRKR